MTKSAQVRGYLGSYLFGVLLLLGVSIRTIIIYSGQRTLIPALIALAAFALFYILEPVLSRRLRWPWPVYFALQTGLVLILGGLRPFLDVNGTLYILLSVQSARSLGRKAALTWNALFIVLLTGTMILGAGLVFGLVIGMLFIAIGIFMVSYDVLYAEAQADQIASRAFLVELQDAHQKLQELASQAEQLVAADERNRLARELHDSVGQTIFSATLTTRSAQLLLEKDPTRVPGQLERLQEMTDNALSQLRSLITQMRPRV
jgi:signal transduction histidine kinase